jgi:hypothetical protein
VVELGREEHAHGGKGVEVLIKSVAQAIPTYTMGVFKLPASASEEITQLIIKFWWVEEGGKWKVH